jgi:hypothetical protein
MGVNKEEEKNMLNRRHENKGVIEVLRKACPGV